MNAKSVFFRICCQIIIVTFAAVKVVQFLKGNEKVKNRIVRIMVGILFVSLISCEDLPDIDQEGNQPGTKYVIKKGNHDSNQFPVVRQGVSFLKFLAKFDSTAVYSTVDPKNQADINKLYGLSDCNSPHQVNSARFGWRWYNNQLEIWAYTYTDSIRDYKLVSTSSFDVYHQYEIAFDEMKYIFKLDDKVVELPRHCSGIANGYKLFPYFGGDESAPHDVTIWIKDLL